MLLVSSCFCFIALHFSSFNMASETCGEPKAYMSDLSVSCFPLKAVPKAVEAAKSGTSKCLETARRKMERSLMPRRSTISEELRKVMSAPVRGVWAIAHIHWRTIKPGAPPARHRFGCPENKQRDVPLLEPRYRHRSGCVSQDGWRSPEQHDKRWVKAYC